MEWRKFLWKGIESKGLSILPGWEGASLSLLTLQGASGKTNPELLPLPKVRRCEQEYAVGDRKKPTPLLLCPAPRVWKGAWKCKPSVRKCKPSVTWVSKKFDITARRVADCHIHLTGLWTLKHLRGFSLDHTASAESSLPAGCVALLISGLGYTDVTQAQLEAERTQGWTEFRSLSWEGASLLSKAAMSWGESLTCCLSKAPCVGN